MTLQRGTWRQKSLLVLLCAIYGLSIYLQVVDKRQRVGAPNVGFMIELTTVSPTRHDASEAGLRGGGRPLSVNGVPVADEFYGSRFPEGTRKELGATNTLRFATTRGDVRELVLEVVPWTWEDAIFTEGATVLIGALFFIVGLSTFVLRPYELASWAQLSLCTFSAAALTVALVPLDEIDRTALINFYFFAVLSAVPAAIAHVGLAFPIIHPFVLRNPWTVTALYMLPPVLLGNYMGGWLTRWQGVFAQSRLIGAAAMMGALVLFIGRCLQLSWYAEDRLIAQRARILLVGVVAGFAPVASVIFLQEIYGVIPVDHRFLHWPMIFFLMALARVSLRHELLNSRIAVRRAVMYAWAVGILTIIAILLSTVRTYAVAALLFPLLYLWPRFDERLNARLQPNRARLPEIIRNLSAAFVNTSTREDVLRVLVNAPRDISDSSHSSAFLFPGGARDGVSVSSGEHRAPDARRLAEEPLFKLMATLRKEILRTEIAIEPQYSNIKEGCQRCFDRLGAELILPIELNGEVVGALAVGPRATGDIYESAEIDALSLLTQQANQSLQRIEATEQLRARELEFNELKRFFSPQVIDQVMEKGGPTQLRTQRKQVTVVFVDLRGFTSFSESSEPEDVMLTLADYHSVMGARIAEFSGTLERFAGDGFMVFFNDPVDQPDHVQRAARMALAMREDAERLRARWQQAGYQIDIGIGVHTGYATCGFIGYEGRRDYGVIGNVTNRAARLSDVAGPGEILISAQVRQDLGAAADVASLGLLELKGFRSAQEVFRLESLA